MRGEVRPDVNGFERKWLPTGTRFLKIHHYADPKKDAAWLESMRVKMADTPLEFRREILMDDTVFGGQPVYENYHDDTHSPSKFRENPIPLVPGSLYFSGWDCGQTLNPAFVLLQVTPSPFQVHCLGEVVSTGGESMNEFAPRVLDFMLHRIPGNWDEVRHYGDATVTTRSGTNKKSARDEAKLHGINISPVSNVWAPRYAAVAWLLSRWIDEKTPGFMIEGKRSPVLRLGFQGAYKYHVSSGGDQDGPGRVLLAPLKNSYSHVHDALQYPAIKIRTMVEGSGGRLQD